MKEKKITGGVKMKTFTKMFLFCCWVFCTVLFANETITDQQQAKLDAEEARELGITVEELYDKRQHNADIEASKTEKQVAVPLNDINAKETATPLEFQENQEASSFFRHFKPFFFC